MAKSYELPATKKTEDEIYVCKNINKRKLKIEINCNTLIKIVMANQ